LLVSFLLVCGFFWGLGRNTPLPLLLPVAFLAAYSVVRARKAQLPALIGIQRRALRSLGLAVLPTAIGLDAGFVTYAPASFAVTRLNHAVITALVALAVSLPLAILLARLLIRVHSDGTRWRRPVLAVLLLVAGVTAATAARWAGVGWTELPASGAAVDVGDGWRMRSVVCPGVHPVWDCGLPGPWRASEALRSALDYESLQSGVKGDGAVLVVELARGATRVYEPLRGRRVWVARRRDPAAWRLCSGGPAAGPCVDSHPGESDRDDSETVLRSVPIECRVVGAVPRNWIAFPLLGMAAAVALLRAATRSRTRWRGARQGRHEGGGWVHWNDGTANPVPGAQALPRGPVIVRELRRTPDLIYRGGAVLDAEAWAGWLSPRLRQAAARADALDAIALAVIVLFGATFVAAAWAVW